MNGTPRHRRYLLTLLLFAVGCDEAARGPQVEAVDSADISIVMTDSEDVPLNLSSEPVRSLGGKDTETESFYQVSAWTTASDASGNLYVLETVAHRIQVFDSTGRHLRTLGGQGGGPGELEFPLSMTVTADGIVRVADVGKRSFVQWNPQGEPIESIRMPQGYAGGPVAATPSGTVVQLYPPGGQRLLLLEGSGSETTLAAIDSIETRTLDLKSCGMGFSGMSPIFSPNLIWAASGDHIIVARNPEYVIDVYEGGRPVRSIRRDLPPRPATAELARASLGEGMRVAVPGGVRVCDSAEVVEQRGFAPHLPWVERAAITPDGQIWIQRYTVNDDAGAIDVFDIEGRYIGTSDDGFVFPIGFLPDGRMLTSEVDELDVERLVIRTLEMR